MLRRSYRSAAAPVKAGFRLGEPVAGELGVRDGHLIDRAFADDLTLAPVGAIPVAGPVGVLDALGAAALARSVGVSARAIQSALTGFRVGHHRSEQVGEIDGVRYVDDSKATNPHAAQASILAYPRVVWIAGGLLKGAGVEAAVARVADRLAGVVLIGRDRAAFAEALSRHASDVPVIQVVTGEDAVVHETDGAIGAGETRVVDASGPDLGRRVMARAVAAATGLARPGDTVLLAPAGASFDQFAGYAERGEAFAAAVRSIS
jgi:UDP-N-acetylmuramoylalanine--D-glutamate ligase